ncbi:MAG TPA: DUF1206 domain-containing protein [Thermoanaerobaculia bacterium]|jgi:hypothetical protein
MARSITGSTFAQIGFGTARPWIERLARIGYAARGAVYVLVGFLAVETAFGARSRPTDTRGALQEMAGRSTALLWAVAVGLAGYALWRIVQGLLNPERKRNDLKGLAHRVGRIGSGLIYGGLAWAAVRIALGARNAGDGHAYRVWTAKLMSEPFGRWLVAAVGIGVIAGGLYQIRRGWTERFRKEIRLQEMDATEREVALNSGKLGLVARGIVFLISGWFLVQAALRFDPRQARGLGGALAALAGQPHGAILLGLVAMGLIAFGAYSILLARYGRIVV